MLSIILSRQDIRENDQIITLYTAEKGKISALARGVKKITSKNSAHLEPFFLVEAEIVPGKEIAHLTTVQPINAYKNIREDLSKMILAGHAVKLLNDLLQSGEPDQAVFLLITDFLDYLSSASTASTTLLDAFLARLLKVLGFDILAAPDMPSRFQPHMKNLVSSGWEDVEQGMDKKSEQTIRRELYRFASFHCERKLAYFSGIR